mgnify:CR=1 FL=1
MKAREEKTLTTTISHLTGCDESEIIPCANASLRIPIKNKANIKIDRG